MRERPAEAIALGFVGAAVAAVGGRGRRGGAVGRRWRRHGARVDAVCGAEGRAEGGEVDAADVAADRVLEFDAVARVFEGDPLDAVGVLADEEGGGGGDGAGGGGGGWGWRGRRWRRWRRGWWRRRGEDGVVVHGERVEVEGGMVGEAGRGEGRGYVRGCHTMG